MPIPARGAVLETGRHERAPGPHRDRGTGFGDVITSAGVSAGIDTALHLVARLAGAERARQVRRGIQYDPRPPV